MSRFIIFSVLLMCSAFAQQPKPHVLLHTQAGDIELELEPTRAPVTTANFLRYIDEGFYDGGVFHRTVTPQNQPDKVTKIEVVQAGVNPERAKQSYPPIPLENTKTTGLHHVDGTLSMARGEPNSAKSDIFICMGEQLELDFGGKRNPDGQGFAAFGHVVRGMDVVQKIQGSAAEGQKLTPPIRILSATRVRINIKEKTDSTH